MKRPFLCALAAAAVGLVPPAFAGNNRGDAAAAGPVTIDQAKAEAGGVTAGDGPGFPVTLSQPGSYRLTGDLVVPDLATTAIYVTSPGVTLDLNGFEIRGPGTVNGLGANLTCSASSLPPGATRGHGVLVQIGGTTPTVQVAGGTIRGMGGHGVHGSNTATVRVERMRLFGNGRSGAYRVDAVTGSAAARNCEHGIAHAVLVMGNTVMSNRQYGIYFANALHNVVGGNGGGERNTVSSIE